jgi:DNA-binding NarL/FixJ family response regulator
MTTRVLIADDHAIVREGLLRILAADPAFKVVGEAKDGHEVLAAVRAGGFEVLLLDLSMPGRSGVDLIKQIKAERPELRVLVLSMHDEQQYAVRAIRAGASGYLTKDTASKQLVAAINKIATGGMFITPAVAEALERRAAAQTLVRSRIRSLSAARRR